MQPEKKVCAGPGEATAIGNIMAQMLHSGELKNLSDARKCVFASFDVRVFVPEKKRPRSKGKERKYNAL